MIDRYSTIEMKKIWTEKAKFKNWLVVELAVLQVLEQHKIVPKGTAAQIESNAKINVKRIAELEIDLKHDVIAFTTSIAEQVGSSGGFFHYGLTSSDVVDTAWALQIRRAIRIIELELNELLKVISRKARTYKHLPCIGRTHGIHAEPMTFGVKFLSWYAELQRRRQGLKRVKRQISFGKLSGAVGIYGVITPQWESEALAKLKLQPEPMATQVIPRDRHAAVMAEFALLAGAVERIAVELRHLQRTEVGEVCEEFGSQQKGSSAMPHKKNPISAENLTGCARLIRGYSSASMENIALWHERDISHSAVERVMFPDASTLLHYMLRRLNGVMGRLHVNTEQVQRNLLLTGGAIFSGHLLLALVKKGVSRESAYRMVQRPAHDAIAQKRSYQELVFANKEIMAILSQKEIEKVFSVKNFLNNTDTLFERVLEHGD